MKKRLILILSLSLLAGCVPLPAYMPKDGRTATSPAAVFAAAEETPTPPPTAVPTSEPTPTPTSTPEPTPTPTPTPPAPQLYTGDCFRFQVPGEWLRADIPNGAYFFPDIADTRHTFFRYQETANTYGLRESTMDLALRFSSPETVTALVEKALTDSGMTGFELAPVDMEKTVLNGLTCYKGVSTLRMGGEAYSFEGHILLRGERMILLIWVGDRTQYAAGLDTIYGSLAAIP